MRSATFFSYAIKQYSQGFYALNMYSYLANQADSIKQWKTVREMHYNLQDQW